MVPEDYRARARQCRVAAARSGDPLRRDFLEAAEAWDMLADQLERLHAISGRNDMPGGGSETVAR